MCDQTSTISEYCDNDKCDCAISSQGPASNLGRAKLHKTCESNYCIDNPTYGCQGEGDNTGRYVQYQTLKLKPMSGTCQVDDCVTKLQHNDGGYDPSKDHIDWTVMDKGDVPSPSNEWQAKSEITPEFQHAISKVPISSKTIKQFMNIYKQGVKSSPTTMSEYCDNLNGPALVARTNANWKKFANERQWPSHPNLATTSPCEMDDSICKAVGLIQSNY